MKGIIQAVFFCTFLISAFGQSNKTEIDYFNIAAKHYYNGKYSSASKSINEGLKAYPNSKKLIELKKCLGQNPKAQEWILYNKNKQTLLKQGFKEGTGGSGYTSKTLTDPNGKKHVFVKKVTPVPPDGWTIFNNQEKQILNSGYQKGEGSAQDEKKELYDPNGNVHYYFKKRPVTTIKINASFRKIGQNYVQWSDDLKNYAEKITIVFNNGVKSSFRENVTGLNSYKFESGDKDYDGVECTVTLEITLKPNVKMLDTPKLKMITHC
jgi:hypothetical protein